MTIIEARNKISVLILFAFAALMISSCSKANQEYLLTAVTNSITEQNSPSAGPGNTETGPDNKNLIAYWPLDSITGGIAADLSGNGHSGSAVNAKNIAARVNNGISLTGYNSGIDVPDGPAFSSVKNFTIMAWFNVQGFKQTHGLLFFRGDGRPGLDPYIVTVYPDSTLVFQVQDAQNGYDRLTYKVIPGKFYHVAAVFKSGSPENKMYLYRDGELVGEKSTSIKPLADLDPQWNPGIGIGHHAYRTDNDYGFIGIIDEVYFYGSALTAEEIKQNYNRK
jgi:hypothetical protein